MLRALGTAGVLLLAASSAAAQPSFTAVTDVYVQDFAAFDGTGYAPGSTSGPLDSNAWRVLGLSDGDTAFGDTAMATDDRARGASDGAVSTGGIYAFDVDNTFVVGMVDYALGVQPTGSDFTPGNHQLQILNDTGAEIRALSVDYEVHYLNDEERSSAVTFRVIRPSDGMEVAVTAAEVVTPEAASVAPIWQVENPSFVVDLDALPIANGEYVILSWDSDDVAGSGSRDEIAIDDILVGIPTCGNGVVDTGETCDDGDVVTETECDYGTMSCMGCNATCTTELTLTGAYCGDGTTDASFEECDDGGTVDGDGCSAACTLEMDAGMPDAGTDAGMADAGTDAGAADAGSDGGVTDAGMDAGTADAGPETDAGAGVDAGPEPDAGPGMDEDAGAMDEDGGAMDDDAGTAVGRRDEGGCGCSAPGAAGATPALGLLALLGLVGLIRRRRG